MSALVVTRVEFYSLYSPAHLPAVVLEFFFTYFPHLSFVNIVMILKLTDVRFACQSTSSLPYLPPLHCG